MAEPSEPAPFSTHAARYMAAGWRGVLPIPPRKKTSPPTGYTGNSGAYPTEVNIGAWAADEPAANIALRMNEDVIGLDVDAYGDKPGAATLDGLTRACGELPPTWTSTSRTDGVSGIRFYRLHQPTKLIGALPGLEIIQRHHRYAVVAPSIHPLGGEYRWISPDGEIGDLIPEVTSLPYLPDAWLAKLREDNKPSQVRRQMATGSEVAPAVDKAYGQAVRGLRRGTRHDAALAGVGALIRLESLGYPGASDSIAQLRQDFLAAVGDSRSEREAVAEWDRMIDGAAAVVASSPSIAPRWEERTSHRGGSLADLIGPSLAGWGAAPAEPQEPWEQPRGLPAPAPGPTFPVESLPAWAQQHAVAAAEQVQVPVDLTAMQIIGALSAACTGRARVHVSPNWVEPVNLYLIVAMRSGAGKSPSDKLIVNWLRAWQRDRIALTMDAYEKAQLKVKHTRKKLTKVEGGEGGEDELYAAYDAVAKAQAEVPLLPRIIADDTSPEAVIGVMKQTGERISILSTEADLYDMLLKGKAGNRANVNIFLKAWSGDSFTRDRKGGQETGPEWTELQAPLLTIFTSIQPAVLARLRSDSEMVSRGFVARFMFSVPDDLIGQRDQTKRFDKTKLTTLDAYETEARNLATRWAGWNLPADLRFSDEAARQLEAFLVHIEPRLGQGRDLEDLAEWANKLHGSIARYAGLLHLAEHNSTQATISAECVDRALILGRYWLDHAAAVLGLDDEVAVEQAESVLRWAASTGLPQVSLADMQAGHRRPGEGLDKVTDFVPAVQMLVDLGWLRPTEPGDWRAEVGIRGSKSPRFALWPECVGKPQTVKVPRVPRTASMGESTLPLSPPIPPPVLGATRFAELTEPTEPIDDDESLFGPDPDPHGAPTCDAPTAASPSTGSTRGTGSNEAP